MQHAVLNLCRVKLRDQQRLAHGPLDGVPERGRSATRCRARATPPAAASRAGRCKCAPGGPNDYIYVIVQPPGWAPIAKLIGRPELADDPEWSTPEARLSKLDKMFQLIEEWTLPAHKWEVLAKLNAQNIPCGPILSTKELIEDETSLADNDMVVTVDHPERGAFKTVGCPLKLSDSPVEVRALAAARRAQRRDLRPELGLPADELAELKANGVI